MSRYRPHELTNLRAYLADAERYKDMPAGRRKTRRAWLAALDEQTERLERAEEALRELSQLTLDMLDMSVSPEVELEMRRRLIEKLKSIPVRGG